MVRATLRCLLPSLAAGDDTRYHLLSHLPLSPHCWVLDSDWYNVTFAITAQHTNPTRCIMRLGLLVVTDHGWRGGGAGATQFRHDLIEAADHLHKPSSHRPHPAHLTLQTSAQVSSFAVTLLSPPPPVT